MPEDHGYRPRLDARDAVQSGVVERRDAEAHGGLGVAHGLDDLVE